MVLNPFFLASIERWAASPLVFCTTSAREASQLLYVSTLKIEQYERGRLPIGGVEREVPVSYMSRARVIGLVV